MDSLFFPGSEFKFEIEIEIFQSFWIRFYHHEQINETMAVKAALIPLFFRIQTIKVFFSRINYLFYNLQLYSLFNLEILLFFRFNSEHLRQWPKYIVAVCH